MAVFHVFVDGAADDSPAGLQKLAEAISGHYGLPLPDVVTRINSGRFRVKGNTDRATADAYVRDLERLGARCSVEEATPQNTGSKTPLPFPAVRPSTPSVSPLPPQPPRTTTGSVLPPQPARTTTGNNLAGYQSGLSAAFANEKPASASLGALEREDVSFALSSVDGQDDAAPDPTSFEPPAAMVSASIGPAAEKPKGKAAKPAKPKDEPLDMFAPPEMQGEEFKVDIAADEVETSARKRVTTPPAGEPVAQEAEAAQRGSTPAVRRSQPSIQPANEAAASAGPTNKLGPLADPRVRTIAGVVLAILLGFVPAHLIARSREKSAFAAIDAKIVAQQEQVDSLDTYAALDGMRETQLARKHEERRNIAILAFAIWAVVGGGIGYAWFRRIPWDRFEA